MIRRLAWAFVGTAVLLGVATWWVMPPRPLVSVPVDWTPAQPVVRGAYHVHTTRSDGSGTWQEVAEAAARTGLAFVIVTDHGDGTEHREPPRYHAGVLVIDGVEISTTAGHYVVIPEHAAPAPYPLAGEPWAVIEDVRRFFGGAGVGIVAHPGSPRERLAWRNWDLPFDGIEWMNADSEWRDEGLRLGRTLLTYPFRPVETLAALVSRPAPVLAEWDRLTATRAVRALAGHDAHARLALGVATDPYEGDVHWRLPPYEVSFGAFSNRVVLAQPWTGDAAADARLLLAAIRQGAVYTTIDGRATPGPFEFEAVAGEARAPMGEWLRAPLGDVTLQARVGAPAGTRLALLHGGTIITEGQEGAVSAVVRASGAYRVEAYLPDDDGRRVPWLLSNPIYVDVDDRYASADAGGADATGAEPGARVFEGDAAALDPAAWTIETSQGSSLDVASVRDADGAAGVRLHYTLAPGVPAGQYVALRLPVPAEIASASRLGLITSADRPARVWLQLRKSGAGDGERWGRTAAIETRRHLAWLPLDQFRPLGAVSEAEVPVAGVTDLLVVVDTVNTAPGTTGSFTIWGVGPGR